MPELPDLTVYLESLETRIGARRLLRVRLLNPFFLRTAVPPIASAEGRKVAALRRLGKLEFESGTLAVTEAGTKRRASLHLVEGADALRFCGCMTRRTVRCRTGSQGFVLLADRSLSHLLKKSWPRSIDELE